MLHFKTQISLIPIVSGILRASSRLFPCIFWMWSRYLPGISTEKPWRAANKKRFVTAQGGVLASDQHRHGDRITNGSEQSLASFPPPLLPQHHCLFCLSTQRRGYFHGRDNCHKILVSFTSTLSSCLFSLCIFPWVDCEQAGDWLGQIMDLKRTREETSPGTWGGRESLHFKSTMC